MSLHLTQKEDNNTPSKQHCVLYIFVYDIDSIYQKCVEEEVQILNVPEERDYQMKDFDILDPDGHIISFGNGQ